MAMGSREYDVSDIPEEREETLWEMPGTALATIPTEPSELAVLFSPGGLDDLLNAIRSKVAELEPDLDISTEAGRKLVAGTARRVSRSKTAIDEAGKSLVENWKRQAKIVDAERKRARDTLDALRDEVRGPLTEWENAETTRISGHEAALAEFINTTLGLETVSIVEVENRIVKVDRLLTQREWQEFLKRALRLHEQSSRTLKQALEDKQRLVEAARLAAEEAAKRQREREEQIAQTAAERARIEAEQKAEREARIAAYAAAKEKQEIEQRARKDAENHARELKEQQEKARRNRQNAVQQERERVAREEQERAEAETRRIADENHRCKIEYEAQAALFLIIGSDRLAERVLEAIIAGEVPHIDIKY